MDRATDPRPADVMQRRLLALVPDGTGARHEQLFEGCPQLVFQPDGIMVFGVDPETTIRSFRIGQDETLLCAPGDVPASIFRSRFTLEELAGMVLVLESDVEDRARRVSEYCEELGHGPGWESFAIEELAKMPRLANEGGRLVSPMQQFQMRATNLGNTIRAHVVGPCRAIVVSGTCQPTYW